MQIHRRFILACALLATGALFAASTYNQQPIPSKTRPKPAQKATPKPGSVSGRVFAITAGGDIKPARMARIYLLSIDGGETSSAHIFSTKRIAASIGFTKDLKDGTIHGESQICQRKLLTYEDAMLEVLKWAEEKNKISSVMVGQADEEGNFKLAVVRPGVYILVAIGRAGFNQAVWETRDVDVQPEAETILKLSRPEEACLIVE